MVHKYKMDFLRIQHLIGGSTPQPEFEEVTFQEYKAPNPDITFPYLFHVISILLPILTCLIGASFLIFIIARKEILSIPTSWLVMNILAAVITHGLIILPVRDYNLSGPMSWKLGEIGCHIFSIIASINVLHMQVSILLLLVDRFILFVNQQNHAQKMAPRIVRLLLISSVIAELLLVMICTYTLSKPFTVEQGELVLCLAQSSAEKWIANYALLFQVPTSMNVLLGIITAISALALCYKINQGTIGAIILILLIGSFDAALCLSESIIIYTHHLTKGEWLLFQSLLSLFHLVVPILIMVLIPEIRIAIGGCCKHEKGGESIPLMKAM